MAAPIRHSLLRRQIKRHTPPDWEPPAGLEALLASVDEAYCQADDDRLMLERAFELCSQELLQANADLRVAKEAAEAANLAKRRFLARMSHELRTPLYAIICYGELVQVELEKMGLAGLAGDIENIRKAGAHLMELINGLLDFAKIEEGRMELNLQDFDVDRLVDELLSIMRPLADVNRNDLTLERPEALGAMHADATKVRQILLNLLGNANKFTSGGRICLRVESAAGGAEPEFVFRIRDTGVGIPAEAQARLFQPFTQIASAAKFAGTGLGLAISRHYCEAMGGRITFESAAGEGSTFTVRLPRRVAGPAGA